MKLRRYAPAILALALLGLAAIATGRGLGVYARDPRDGKCKECTDTPFSLADVAKELNRTGPVVGPDDPCPPTGPSKGNPVELEMGNKVETQTCLVTPAPIGYPLSVNFRMDSRLCAQGIGAPLLGGPGILGGPWLGRLLAMGDPEAEDPDDVPLQYYYVDGTTGFRQPYLKHPTLAGVWVPAKAADADYGHVLLEPNSAGRNGTALPWAWAQRADRFPTKFAIRYRDGNTDYFEEPTNVDLYPAPLEGAPTGNYSNGILVAREAASGDFAAMHYTDHGDGTGLQMLRSYAAGVSEPVAGLDLLMKELSVLRVNDDNEAEVVPELRLVEVRDADLNQQGQAEPPLRSVRIDYNQQGLPRQFSWDLGDGQEMTHSYEFIDGCYVWKHYDPNNVPDGSTNVEYTETVYGPLLEEGVFGPERRVDKQYRKRGEQILTTVDFQWDRDATGAYVKDASGYDTTVTTSDGGGQVVELVRYGHHPETSQLTKVSVMTDGEEPSAGTTYEIDGRVGVVTKITDPEGRVTEFDVDLTTRAIKTMTVAPGSANLTTTFEYNDRIQITKTCDPTGRCVEYDYCEGTPGALPQGCGVVGALRRERVLTGGSGTPLVTEYVTNGVGQVVATKLPDGTWNSQSFDDLGFPDETTVAASNVSGHYSGPGLDLVTDQDFTWRGDLACQTNLQGIKTCYEYNLVGWPSALVQDVDGREIRTETRYDSAGNPIEIVEDVGGIERTTRMVYGQRTPSGQYLLTQLMEAVGTPEERVTTYEYDAVGEREAVIEESMGGRTTTYVNEHFADGRKEFRVKLPGRNGKAQVTRLNATGQVLETVDERGVTSRMEYYAGTGWLEKTILGTQSVDGDPAANVETSRTYYPNGQVHEVFGPSGYKKVTKLDAYGRPYRFEEYDSGTLARYTELELTPRGWAEYTKVGRDGAPEVVTRTLHDQAGRVSQTIVDPGGLALLTSYSYGDGGSDRWNLASVTDPEGNVTSYSEYDHCGQIGRTTDASGTPFDFERDDLCRLVEQSGAERAPQVWEYDQLDRVKNLSHDGRTEHWIYRADGSVDWYCPFSAGAPPNAPCPRSHAEAWRYKYNSGGQGTFVAAIDYPERSGITTADASYEYYANGVLRAVHDANGDTEYVHGAWNQMLSKTRTSSEPGSEPRTLTYKYKPGDVALASMDYFGQGTVRYETNALKQVVALTNWAGEKTTYGYRATGQLATASANMGEAYDATRTYDSAGRLSRIQYLQGGNNLLDLNYAPAGALGRDANGNPWTIHETWQDEAPLVTQYEYDEQNRLTRSCYPTVPGSPAYCVDLPYDKASNLKTIPNGLLPLSHDASDRISTPGFEYDENGNLTKMPELPKRDESVDGVVWYRAEGNAIDSQGTVDAQWHGSESYASGSPGLAFELEGDHDGVLPGKSFVEGNPQSNFLTSQSNALNFSATLDVAATIRADKTHALILSKGNNAFGNTQWALWLSPQGKLCGGIATALPGATTLAKPEYWVCQEQGSIPLGVFTTVRLVFDGTQIKLFAGDVTSPIAVRSVPDGATIAFGDGPLFIGAHMYGVAYAFDGAIDDVVINGTGLQSVPTLDAIWHGAESYASGIGAFAVELAGDHDGTKPGQAFVEGSPQSNFLTVQASSLDGPIGLDVSALVRPDRNHSLILSKGNNAWGNTQWAMWLSPGGKLCGGISASLAGAKVLDKVEFWTCQEQGNVPLGEVTKVRLVFDGVQIKLFAGDPNSPVAVYNVPTGTAVAAGDGPLMIGAHMYGVAYAFDGAIGEVFVNGFRIQVP